MSLRPRSQNQLNLIFWRLETIIGKKLKSLCPVGGKPLKPTRNRSAFAAGDPVLVTERAETQQGWLPDTDIALVFGDDQRQAGDLSQEVAQLNTMESW